MADQHPTPEQDVAIARQALASGDLKHALHHVGCALATEPMHPEWLPLIQEIVGQIVATQPDPLALVPLGGNVSFIDAANRSWVLAWMRRWEEALDLVTDVAEVRPDVPYLRWAEWWFAQQGVAQAMTFEQLARGILVDLAKIAAGCPVPIADDDPRKPNVEAAARLMATIRPLHPREAFVWFLSAMIQRRLGTTQESLQWAQQAYQLEAAWKNAIGVANALRDLGQLDGAASWYQRALEHDRDDVSALLDTGDMYLDAGRWDDAIRAYERVLAKQPDHPWATPGIHYARFKQAGDPTQRLCLLRLTEGDDPGRAIALARRLDPPQPYVTNLPRPGDASCNALNHIFEQMYQDPAAHFGSRVELELSHLESPSVVAAFALQMEMWGTQVALDYKVRKIQQPDPRQPRAQVAFQLWQWDGASPRPGVPVPDPRVRAAIQDLAMEPFHLEIWLPIAERLGRQLGPGAVPSIVGTMVFPPRPNGGAWRVLNWTQRCQVAAALVLAFVDDGWAGSHRQRALYSLLYGPMDWTVGAAIVALGVLARRDRAIRAEVEQAFAWMRSSVPPEGFCPWVYPLACTWLSFDLDAATRADVERWRDELLDQVGQTTVHVCRIEAKKFDMAEEVARAQAAQQQVAAGGGGDPDPVVFPGQPVARLSDYVGLMKQMQTGNMMGALSAYGLDMMAYASVATAWGQQLAADATLNAKFQRMMTGG